MKQVKRSIVSVVMLLTFLVGQAALFAIPEPAHAQWAVTNPDLVAVETQKNIGEIIKENLKNAFIAAIGTTLMNTLFYSVGNVAQRTAVWVASGGPGDQPLYSRETARDFGRNTGAVAVMSVYDSLSEEDILRNIDIDIDIPDEAAYLLGLRQGLKSAYVEPDYDFDFTDYRDSYPAYLASVAASNMTAAEKTQAILGMSATSFSTNEFGNGLKLYSETLIDAQNDADAAAAAFYANGGFLDQVDPTSGYRDLPAEFVKDQLYDDLRRAQDLPYTTFSNMFSGDNVLLQLGVYGGQVFTGTLVSELMNRYYGGLFEGVSPSFSTNPFDPDSTTSFSRERAQQLFQGFTAFRPIQVTDYHMVSQLSSCATSRFGSSRPLFSCAMDTSFAAAVTRAETGATLTIEDAIDEGYINGSWPLIPPTDTSRNQDDDCYTYGFCHSNLVKMRKARIISIGWEMAAESDQNTAENPVTLQEVLDGFYDCNEDGERDADHAWCHLIDPSWVLKAPESSCRTLAYGQLLQASGSATREQECVDVQTCIAEDENGQCTGGYGYCVREENTWRFQGESCPEQYAGCLSFETRDDELVDYITTTADFADCGEDEVGCQWYATTQYLTDEGDYEWPEITDVEEALDGNDAQMRIAFFNGDAELCDESEAGCSEVYPRGTNLNLNLIPNSSFEIDDDENGWPDGWFSENWSNLSYDTEDNYARSGEAAVATGTDNLYRYGVSLNQSRFYTLTYYSRQESSGADTVTVKLQLSDTNGAESIDLSATSYSDDCSIEDLDGDGSYETISLTSTPSSDEHERAECIFTSPTLSNQASNIDGYLLITGSTVWVDDIQIVQSEDISTFHVGYNATGSSQYVQLAPDYLGCTGAETDSAACDDFAQVCSANDVGCALYSPLNGDPDVSGVVSELDICSEGCVGYDTYKQEATRYEPNGEFPLYFIPDSAETCDEEAVGCDEFTNLTTEENEYYTYLRACITDDQADSNTGGDQSAIFYTWEGSDEEGYQLRTWSLLESDLDGLAYQNYIYTTSGEVDADAGAGPCTNWKTDEDGITCSDDADGDLKFDTDTEDCDEHDDILENPDCREFYDVDGDIHYRLWSETVTVNNACVSYRKTDVAGLGSDTDGSGVDDGQENCTDAGGYFDTATNICRFYGFSEESTSCADQDAGCRAYTGGRSNNSRVALTDLFESGDLTDWEAANATDVELSNESIATGGHSLKSTGETFWTYQYDEGSECADEDGCASSGSILGGECTVIEGKEYCGTLNNQLYANKTYTLSFWAKGAGELSIGFDIESGSSPAVEVAFEEGLELTSDWKQYSVGPLDMNENDYADFGSGTVLVFDPTSTTTVWVDNVVLREGEDELTLIKDSWVTPATCDINLEGNASPQYQLGCQEYLDSDGDVVYLKSFSRLCDGDKVGCKAYYETHESESEYAGIVNGICSDLNGTAVTETTDCYLLSTSSGTAYDTNSPQLCIITAGDTNCHFDLEDNAIPVNLLESTTSLAHISYGPETVIVPADRDLYAIVGSDDTCNAGGVGCTALGSPELAFDRSVVKDWEDTYIIDDPDTYADTRCQLDEAWCEAFDAGSEGVYYFKDPGNSLCEYKTGVAIGGESYDGWFREGTAEFCYGSGSCADSGTSCTTDSDCRANTGSCSDTGTSCSQDYDCNADAFCADLSTESCVINDPSFLKSGTFSGAWKNGDEDYLGYVATCDSNYDTCSEFEDPLAIDDDEFYGNSGVEGENFHFLNNDRLEDTDILTSASCKGQVSSKEGCVLFEDAADASLDYNASATYISSVHADELHGDEPFALVDPIDCSDERDRGITLSDGTEVDLCAQRCVYDRGSIDPDGGDPASGKFREERVSGDDSIYGIDDIWVFGSSCYVDSDCVDYEGVTGDLVQGTCETRAQINTPLSIPAYEDVPVLENDTNRVMSVARDRVCSEWLACASSFTVWDDELGKYREVCDSINLCTDYSESGDAFCSEWDPDDPAIVLDIERYTNRDVSWYGEEYSGYAIPDQFPVQHLSQVNIAPEKVCGDSATGTYIDVQCDADSDCSSATYNPHNECLTPPSDYRLVYDAGECPDTGTGSEYGETCTVGYCSNDSSACTEDGQCKSGSCITGSCFDLGTDVCSVDSDCGATEICLGGFCSEENTDVDGCDLDFTCGATTATCVASVSTLSGTCYSDRCVVSPDGYAFNDADSEELNCRAYPESDSPFGNNVVEEWIYANPSGAGSLSTPTSDVSDLPKTSQPYDTISGYENTSLCAFGEDCVCSYDTVKSSLGHEIHIDPDVSIANIRDEVEDFLDDIFADDLSGAELGICSGGSNNGGFCLINGAGRADEFGCYPEDTADPDTAIAVCNPITQGDTLVGLEGYCLERDTGINLEGDPTTGACLTWYPVDQLAGTTNLYAKETKAGYFADTYICSDARGHIDIMTSVFEEQSETRSQNDYDAACAEMPVSCPSDGGTVMSSCAENAYCPGGFYAVLGACARTSTESGNTLAESCRVPGAGFNDCPYICVPENSYHGNNPEEACLTPRQIQDAGGAGGDGYQGSYNSKYNTTVYMWTNSTGTMTQADFQAYDDFVEYYRDCRVQGVRLDDELTDWFLEVDGKESDTGIAHSSTAKTGYRDVVLNYDRYPACNEFVQVADSESYEGYAWTNRLYTADSDLKAIDTNGYPNSAYTYDLAPAPFGIPDIDPLAVEAWAPPVLLAACEDGGSIVNPSANDNFVTCDSYSQKWIGKAMVYTGTDPADPDARHYIDYDFVFNSTTGSYPYTSQWSVDPSSTTDARTALFERINQLFAYTSWSSLAKWDDGFSATSDDAIFEDRSYEDKGSGSASKYDSYDDVRGSEGEAPDIIALDVDNCFGPYCREGTVGKFTINSTESGDLDSQNGFFSANVKFYAAANEDQLPLRRVIVDWADDEDGLNVSGSEDADNFYKNRRGIQPDSQSETYCDLATEWGMTADSCDPNYFNFSHSYFCSDSIIDDLEVCTTDDDGNATNSPCVSTVNGAEVCTFRPRVHLRDNWGWCSGTCENGTPIDEDGRGGCYAGNDYGLSETASLDSECAYEAYPSSNSSVDPWVYYDGNIYVGTD